VDLKLPMNMHNFVKDIPVIENIQEPGGFGYGFGTEVHNNISPVVLVSCCWAIGFLFMLAVLIKKMRRFHRVIKNAEVIHDINLKGFISIWKLHLNIRREVCIVSSDEFLSPFTTGLLRPVIYIPRAFLDSGDSGAIHSVIAHEMVHIKRYDALKIKFQNIIQIIYFFNPVVWYASRQISLAREEICDSAVLAGGMISPSVYGDSILKALKFNLFGLEFAGFLPGFGNHKESYKRRIKNILKENLMKKQKKIIIILTVCILGIFILPLANYISAAQDGKSTGSGDFKIVLPINGGKITSFFGWRKKPFDSKGKDFHTGIDIAAPEGTPIYAADNGFVVKAGWKDGYGYLVILQHDNGYSTYYAKCSKILVKEGQTVKAGDTIGACGHTGQATGNHLHFEIQKGGESIDPYPYLPPNISIDPAAKEMMINEK
jgi:murein DD-endopeptidase MepM/ murein hydrolase activator NlpD